MTIKYMNLTIKDFPAVDRLMKANSRTLGFLPAEAIREYLDKGTVLGAKSDDGRLVGYLLYATNHDRFRVVHLCVSRDFRKQGIAKQFVNQLKKSATTQKTIQLNCRRDYEANAVWEELGFVPIAEKPGRAVAGSTLTIWHYTLASDDQLSLFEAKVSDEAIDVAIDTQIFIDLENQAGNSESRALLEDFMADSLNFCITDEILVEINRSHDRSKRERGRQRITDYGNIQFDRNLAENHEETLKDILPSSTDSQLSDIRHLAKTAASDISIFLTRDEGILRRSDRIYRTINLRIMRPHELIVKQHQFLYSQAYRPIHVSGVALRWHRLSVDSLASFSFQPFLMQGEGVRKFRQILNPFLTEPQYYISEVLSDGDHDIAIRVRENGDKILTLHVARLASPLDNRPLFGRFLIFNAVTMAVEGNHEAVKIKASSVNVELVPHLVEMGFLKYGDDYIKFCFSKHLNRKQTLSAITKNCLSAKNDYQNFSKVELQRRCSPLSLDNVADMNFFILPIKQGYAMSLVDTSQSTQDLFGGDQDRLLRWDNVYYKKKTHHRILKPPARILWYVTGSIKKVVAVSHLDEVFIDTPKLLHRKYKKLGVLEWNDIFEICGGDVSAKIMALKFSHTFPFGHPVSLDDLRAIYKKESKKSLSVQGPLKISENVFQEVFQRGYEKKSKNENGAPTVLHKTSLRRLGFQRSQGG